MEIKESLLMGKTQFEMRGNLANKEPKLVEKWQNNDIYSKANENKTLGEYKLHDGPPYANGSMHCGHMLNRVLKDFVVRYKNMKGYKTNFNLGWDTHGLPIETAVTKSGVNRKSMSIVDFRKLCDEYAHKQIENQKGQIRRLGIFADYDHPYFTLMKEFEASEIHCFAKMALKGLIYKGLKPVYWSPSSESALAEAEIEYQDVKAYTIFVAFDVKDGKDKVPSDTKFIIWTTTPWTLPANLAICAHPQFVYGLYKTDKGNFVFLTSLKEKLSEKIGFTSCELVKEFKGSELENIVCKHPFYDRDSIVINADYVTDSDGTGLVHIAPGHGADDYFACIKYGIKPYCPVDEHGIMMEDCGPRLAGKFYEDANLEVLKILEENKCLLKMEEIVHSYPHDWRTHKPVIFRATPQWFCSIEPIREELLKEINNVNWTPSWGKVRMENMIKDRADWCISRQRVWGVPLPIIYCEDGSPIIEKEVFDHIEEVFKEHGSNGWFALDEKDLLPKGYTNPKSPNGIFRKETDTMDVWFDSGSSWNFDLVSKGEKYPCDLYLEGSDQYRGWFNSSLIVSVATNGVSPYKNIVSHGYVLDASWEKMSKSKGNGIDPMKICNVYGADILRLWVASIDYQQDVRISEDIIKQNIDIYRKIRNTFKFMLANLNNGGDNHFELKDKVDYKELTLTDKYILNRLYEVSNNFDKDFNNSDFLGAMSLLNKFISDDLSSLYLDIVKDSLYCDDVKSLRRRQIQTVLNECIFTLMRLLNPILPFTMDEVNEFYPLKSKDSPQFYEYPEHYEVDLELIKNYQNNVIAIRNDVLKAIEIKRNEDVVHKNEESSLNIEFKDPLNKEYVLNNLTNKDLKELFICSHLHVEDKVNGYDGENIVVEVNKDTGIMCNRCRNYFNDDEIKEYGEGVHLCKRCQEIVEK